MVHIVVGQQYPHALSVVDHNSRHVINILTYNCWATIDPHTLSVVDQISRIYQYFDINVSYWYMDIFCL